MTTVEVRSLYIGMQVLTHISEIEHYILILKNTVYTVLSMLLSALKIPNPSQTLYPTSLANVSKVCVTSWCFLSDLCL